MGCSGCLRTHLNDEVADDSTVVGVHARAESVENSGDAHLQVQLRLVGIPVRIMSKR